VNWLKWSDHRVLSVDRRGEHLRHLRCVGNVGWVLLDEVLRNRDVLHNRLGLGSCLNWNLDHLWAHELVLKGLLVFSHSGANNLDVLLSASEWNREYEEREYDNVVNSVRNAFFGKTFVNSRHPFNEVLRGHIWVCWASSGLKLLYTHDFRKLLNSWRIYPVGWRRWEFTRLLFWDGLVDEPFKVVVTMVHGMVMWLEMRSVSMVVLVRVITHWLTWTEVNLLINISFSLIVKSGVVSQLKILVFIIRLNEWVHKMWFSYHLRGSLLFLLLVVEVSHE